MKPSDSHEKIRRRRGLFPAVSVLALLALWAGLAAAGDPPVRETTLAGRWYLADPKVLEKRVRKYIADAGEVKAPGRLVALAVPHAGHMYSGHVAGHGFALLQHTDVETVILVGPSHRARFRGVSLNARHYETPLGVVRLDGEMAERIRREGPGLIVDEPRAHEREHCLEIELPFLQVARPGAKIVPLLMGSQDLETCRSLGGVLARAVKGRKALLLCSTDLSHFHTGGDAEALDGRLMEKVKAFDPEGLHAGLSNGDFEACGGGPLAAVMMAARELGADQAFILKYAHSGHVTGDHSQVVGYMAAAFTRGGAALRTSRPGVDLGLKQGDQQRLLEIARRAIRSALDGGAYVLPDNLPKTLMTGRGAFVTLKKDGELRGCIGRLTSDEPLARVVAQMAVQAAFYDPRFPEVTRDELDGLSVEISVLTPFQRVTDVGMIEVGRHGLLVARGGRRGLLLPQVPVEQGWDRESFLDNTCRKAGLPNKAWREAGTEIYCFSAQVFGEE